MTKKLGANGAPREVAMEDALAHLGQGDPRMARLIERHGPPPLERTTNVFASLARAIIYQQLSGKAANTICGRFEALWEGENFPRPEQVLGASPESLRAVGLSRQKASYLQDLAARFCRGEVRAGDFDQLTDEEIARELTAVKGIGQWSADMFLIFALNRPDVLPVGDLGIQKGMQIYFRMRTLPKPERMIRSAAPWRPYRSVACWYMYRVAENGLNP